MKQAPAINGFKGEYRFLSNFWPCEITIVGISYRSTEAAYQASKTIDITARKAFSNVEPTRAKTMGRSLEMRPSWDDVTKVECMELCLRAKFAIPALRRRLISTGNAELIEDNTWGDRFWGVSHGEGRNVMGKLLMMLRGEANMYVETPILDNSPDIPF